MYRKLALLVAVSIVTPLAGCGASKRCTERNPASFQTFVQDEWRAYCEDYRTHVEGPSNYALDDLAEFFSHHPAKVKELNKSLFRFEKYETCFDTPKAELDLRNLQTCLQDNDQSDVEITNASMALAEPWIQELQFRVQEISPRVSDADRESERQLKKVGEAFDFHRRVEGNAWESLGVELKSLDKAMKAIEGTDKEFTNVLAKAQGHDALVGILEEKITPQVNAITADVGSLRGRHQDLVQSARYLEFASNAAGVKCPKSKKKARKELKIAKKIVAGRNSEVAGSGIRILTSIRPDVKGDVDFERFEGFVCGLRGADNQFEGLTRLCGQYRWVVERQKASTEKKWEDWRLRSFEESGTSGGVDCALKKK